MNGYYADARRVVAAVSGSKADSPSCLEHARSVCCWRVVEPGITHPERYFNVARVLCAFLGIYGVFASEHLDKGMALVPVHDACLDGAEAAEDISELSLGAAVWYSS